MLISLHIHNAANRAIANKDDKADKVTSKNLKFLSLENNRVQ